MTPPFDRRAIPAELRFTMWGARDGGRLRAFAWRQRDGTAVRGQLLFQTGRADFAEKYLETLAHWHARGWNVAGFDWRGQGGSQQPAGEIPDLATMLSDLRDFVRAWRGQGSGPHVAIGHSMGGHLLLRMMVEDSGAIDAAVLVAPMLALNSRPLPSWIASRIARLACAIGQGHRAVWNTGAGAAGRQARLTGDADRYSDELYWMARNPGFAVQPPRWDWLAEAYAANARLARRGVLERIAVPILLIGATQDRLVDADAIRSAAARLPQAEIMMRADAAHELLREVDPVRNAVLARIDGFLDAFGPA
ncbi:alpha/beta hydrolase [Sphingomonas sp.]|uniref:alpha/beta hydrolase n=1 Tax=Sphingomonas sp. TaxID=28214 RepID=UPI002EDA000D